VPTRQRCGTGCGLLSVKRLSKSATGCLLVIFADARFGLLEAVHHRGAQQAMPHPGAPQLERRRSRHPNPAVLDGGAGQRGGQRGVVDAFAAEIVL
jgi:hypothetical protein